MSRAIWGTPALFAAGEDKPTFRVRVDGGAFGPVVTNLALAAAQARAAALGGRAVEIVAVDGTAAAVELRDGRFAVTPWGPASWPLRCERLLAEHG